LALGYSSIGDKWVCKGCVAEKYLRQIVESDGQPGECSYCGESVESCLEADDLVPIVTKGILSEYEDAANSVGYCSDEGGYLLDTMDNVDIIQEVFDGEETAQGFIDDLAEAIPICSWVKKNPYGPWEHEVLVSAWEKFSRQVKYHTRFLFYRTSAAEPNDPDDPGEPYEILDAIGQIAARLELVHSLPLGSALFRVRVHVESETLVKASELGPPPDEHAGANRMSPAGISVFYGADSLTTAVAETVDLTRTTGKVITAGSFRAIRDLRILDLTNLQPIPSIFDEDWWGARYLVFFLHRFVAEVTKPIKRDGREHIDYIPTQVVAEYFRRVFRDWDGASLDGIRYPSPRNPGGYNCVLFASHGEINDAALGYANPGAILEFIDGSVKRMTPVQASRLVKPASGNRRSAQEDP